jgi:hypothetical protein
MARRPASFRQADLTRALKAAAQAGLRVAEALITRDGSIRLVFAISDPVPVSGNPLDKEFGCHGGH